MKNKIYAVLLAGGRGTRLWPLSTKTFSKSFVRIGKERPLISQCISRLKPLIAKGNIIVVADKAQAKLARSFAHGLPERNILIEPFGRSTASAVGLAAINLKPEDIMVVLPTDALIEKPGAYRRALRSAINFARKEKNALVCVGVIPKEPSTSYGYITASPRAKKGIHSVDKFIEKPGKEKARCFMKNPNYLWNAGIFIFKAKNILKAMSAHARLLYGELSRVKKDRTKLKEAYKRMKNVSIDYQIMEKAKNLYCAKGNFSWSDLGNWKSIAPLFKKDRRGNNLFGKAALVDTRNCVIYNSTKEKLGVVGLKDTIVARTKNGTLVCSKKNAEKVKELTVRLERLTTKFER